MTERKSDTRRHNTIEARFRIERDATKHEDDAWLIEQITRLLTLGAGRFSQGTRIVVESVRVRD